MASSDKSIHNFANGTLTENSLFPMAYPSGAGYASGKISASELGEGLGTEIDYQSLNTGDKTLFGAINEINAIGGHSLAVTGTLTAGQTSITLSDSAIKTDSWLVPYTSVFGVNCIDMVASNGSVTLTFEEQSQDVDVGVEIRGVSDGSGGLPVIELADNVWIATSGTERKKSPVDANNYITVSGNVATIKRSVHTYWAGIELYLEANKTYVLVLDGISMTDGNAYFGTITGDPDTATTIIVNRTATYTGVFSTTGGVIRLEVGTSGWYDVLLGNSATTDLVITNPRMIEV